MIYMFVVVGCLVNLLPFQNACDAPARWGWGRDEFPEARTNGHDKYLLGLYCLYLSVLRTHASLGNPVRSTAVCLYSLHTTSTSSGLLVQNTP